MAETESSKLTKPQSQEPVDERGVIVKIREGLNFRLGFAIAAGAFGSAFQHGYNTGVVNAPQTLVMDWIMECNETMVEGQDPEKKCVMSEETGTIVWSWVVASFCVGGIIGGSAVGWVASGLGRKGGLLLNNILMAISGVFMFVAKYVGSWEMLIIGRLLIGVNSGLNAGLAPMYLTEISPTALRGAVGTVYQLIITISIFLSQSLA